MRAARDLALVCIMMSHRALRYLVDRMSSSAGGAQCTAVAVTGLSSAKAGIVGADIGITEIGFPNAPAATHNATGGAQCRPEGNAAEIVNG